MKHRTSRLLVLGLLLIALPACQKEAGVSQTDEGNLVLGATEQTETTERSVQLGARTLVLDGFTGRIRLDGSDTADLARLEFTKHARGRDAAAAAEVLERTTLEESGDDQAYSFKMRSRDAALSQVDVSGAVPRGTRVQIRLESGQVELSGIDGPLDVQTQGGTVRIAGAGESVEVETRNGNIDVAMGFVPAGSTVALRAANGDVSLTMPGNIAARVEAQTGSGDIRIAGLQFADRNLSPRGAGSSFEGQLGQGGAQISLRTENGVISLNEGQIMTLPRTDSLSLDDPMTIPADTMQMDTLRTDTIQAAPPLSPIPDSLDAARRDTADAIF